MKEEDRLKPEPNTKPACNAGGSAVLSADYTRADRACSRLAFTTCVAISPRLHSVNASSGSFRQIETALASGYHGVVRPRRAES